MPKAALIHCTALCAAIPIKDGAIAEPGEPGAVPEWVHLLPAGEIRTADARGPYRVASMQAIADKLVPGEKLPIDECHSTDRAAPLGQPAPARGWITELQARANGNSEDGLWGRVEWTETGKALMADRAYRGISPVIVHDIKKTVLGVLRASLINTPNLKGLVALHSEETGMDWKAKLIELLGLGSDADDEAVMAAIVAKMEEAPALQAQMQAQVQAADGAAIVALQGELVSVTNQLNALTEAGARKDAAAFVDAAIADGRVGVKPLRDRYVAMHMADPENTEALIGALPKVAGTTHAADAPAATDDAGLSASDRTVMALMGISEDEMKARRAAAGQQKEAL